MLILAHDLATCTGQARGDPAAGVPVLSHIRLPSVIDGDRGPMFSTYRRHLVGEIEAERPDLFMFEAPILPKPFIKYDARKRPVIVYPTSIGTTTVLQGLAAVAEEVCTTYGVPCEQTTVAEVKKMLTGSGSADKDAMVAAARKMGLSPAVHDEADALGVWLVAVYHHARRELPRFDKLLYGWSAPN